MTHPDLDVWLLVWLAAAGWLLARHWGQGRGTGLVLTYVLSYGAIHWLAAALYALPWYGGPAVDVTVSGLRVASVGMVAFALGGEVGVRLSQRLGAASYANEGSRLVSPRVVTLYIAAGVIAYGVLAPMASGVPTVSAVVATMSSLMVLGVALKAWNGWQAGRRLVVWFWLGVSAGFPLMTLVGQGFLGFGFASMVIVAAFVASFYRPRWQVVVAGLLVAYLGMSVYVTYMRDRRDIRAVVWGGDAIAARLDRVADTFGYFEWFDVSRVEHLRRVDDRLNQNALVGAAVEGIETEAVALAMGGTLADAALALVPRALWPGKPMTAGSGHVVSDYTGLTFAEGTSVGIGHVMEWYINFALPGVVLGFGVMGGLLVVIDRSAGAWLQRGDVGRFSMWFLPGTSLLAVGGSFVETTASAAAAWGLAWGFWRVTRHWDASADARRGVTVERPS